MALAKCARCKKLFDKSSSAVCPKCQDEEGSDREKVLRVMEDQPGLNAEQLAEEADVDIECVLRMLEEGLLANMQATESVRCGRCGAPAISLNKRLCQACLDKLNTEVLKAQMDIRLPEKRNVRIGEPDATVRSTVDDKRRA